MKRSFMHVITLALSAAIACGVIFLGASNAAPPGSVGLDCAQDLRVQANFSHAPGERGLTSQRAAATRIATSTLDSYDAISTSDGYELVRSGGRTIAAVTVIETASGFVAEGIEACAEDFVSP